jgi:hypothetical protein
MIKINLLPSEERRQRKISLPTISGRGAVGVAGRDCLRRRRGGIWVLQAARSPITKPIRPNEDALPRQYTRVSNATFIGKSTVQNGNAMILRGGTDYALLNSILIGAVNCLDIDETGGTSVDIKGVTFSNFIIADFMTSMEKSGRFTDISLKKAFDEAIAPHPEFNVVSDTGE